MTQIHGTGLKYLRNGFTMLEIDERFKYVLNDVYIQQIA